MGDDREGPSVRVEMCCFGCRYERSESYRCQGDSGHDVYCDHPDRAGRRIGDTTWQTPEWCPLVPDVSVESLRARVAELEAERDDMAALLRRQNARVAEYEALDTKHTAETWAAMLDGVRREGAEWMRKLAADFVAHPMLSPAIMALPLTDDAREDGDPKLCPGCQSRPGERHTPYCPDVSSDRYDNEWGDDAREDGGSDGE